MGTVGGIFQERLSIKSSRNSREYTKRSLLKGVIWQRVRKSLYAFKLNRINFFSILKNIENL